MRIVFVAQSEHSINIYCKLVSFSFVCFNSSEKLFLCIVDPPLNLLFCLPPVYLSFMNFPSLSIRESPSPLSYGKSPCTTILVVFLVFLPLFHEHFLLLSLFFLFDDSFLRKNAKFLRNRSEIIFHLAVGLTDSMTRYRTLD